MEVVKRPPSNSVRFYAKFTNALSSLFIFNCAENLEISFCVPPVHWKDKVVYSGDIKPSLPLLQLSVTGNQLQLMLLWQQTL